MRVHIIKKKINDFIKSHIVNFSHPSTLYGFDVMSYTLSQKKRNILEVAFLLEKSVYQ